MTEPTGCDRVSCYLDGIELVDARPEVVWVPSERDLQQRQEAVHPGQQTLGTAGEKCLVSVERHSNVVRLQLETSFLLLLRVCRGVLGGNAVKHDDSVGQVRRHDEVVLHHERRLLGVEDVPVGVHVQTKRS